MTTFLDIRSGSLVTHVHALRRLAVLAAAAGLVAGRLVGGPLLGSDPTVDSMHPNVVSVHPTYALAGKAEDAARFGCQNVRPGRPRCYSPQQIQTAYDFNPLYEKGITGKGRSIVIIDAYSNPYISTDLAVFDQVFGLPDPVLEQVAPHGQIPFDITDGNQVGWSAEISLDVLWAHAMAPDAKIVLVLAKSGNDPDLLAATKYAIDHDLGDVISQSYGEAESCVDAKFERRQHRLFEEATRKGITIVAAAGDLGAGMPSCDFSDVILSASTPATDPLVTAVGGTNLIADPMTGSYGSERAWADEFSGCPAPDQGCSGGGFSDHYGRPIWQIGTPNTKIGHRGVPDVAYNAGVDGAVITHWGVGLASAGLDPTGQVFFIFGGTSSGAPQWAGLVALADQANHGRVGLINPELYAIAKSPNLYGKAFHDIRDGTNTIQISDTETIPGYDAAQNWDPVTGLGTPDAAKLVPLLARLN